MKISFHAPRHLYIHYPLCAKRCTYCAFNVTVRREGWANQFSQSVLRSLEHRMGLHDDSFAMPPLRTVYMGGGTPSLMEMEQMEGILKRLNMEPGCEVTLEVNPTTLNSASCAGMLAAWKAAGVNRLSIGVQSLDDMALPRLGRQHTAADAMRTLEEAAKIFSPARVSADLMISLPVGWHSPDWKLDSELKGLCGLVDHLSIYELTLEASTPLTKLFERGQLAMPTPDEKADQYEAVVEGIESLGWQRYEISSFSRSPASESQHNWAYWNGSTFLGLGPGAHGRLRDSSTNTLYETVEIAGPSEWASAACASRNTMARCRPLSFQEESHELLLSCLRTREGMSASCRSRIAPFIDLEQEQSLIDSGFLVSVKGDLKATARGLIILDSVLDRLFVRKK